MISVQELATRFCVNPETVRRWIRNGDLQAEVQGQRHLIPERSLHAFLEKHPKYKCFLEIETNENGNIYFALTSRIAALEVMADSLKDQQMFIRSEIQNLKRIMFQMEQNKLLSRCEKGERS